MKKALLKSNNASIKQANKRKYIKGGAAKYNFDIDKTTNFTNIIKIIAKNNTDTQKINYITYYTKSTKGKGRLDWTDYWTDTENTKDITFNIITAN